MNVIQEIKEAVRTPYGGILVVKKSNIKFAWWPVPIWCTYDFKRSYPCWLGFYKQQEFMHGAIRNYSI